MEFITEMLGASWHILVDSSPYIIFGLIISGLLRVFLNPAAVSTHLGQGRFTSVLKASILGIPLPLCSCGVLPAAVGLKKQGAGNGAVTAFMISTPESGVDSIAVTYALLDPVMTVARPAAAFATAAAAGLAENALGPKEQNAAPMTPDLTCPVDGCCDGVNCDPKVHSRHHTLAEKTAAGIRFAFKDVWADMASWFFVGIFAAGIITALIPDEVMARFLGGGLSSMLLMLVVGVPLYICATASTPIAAALILKGVSPGAALVLMLAGPATNITSLTVLIGVLGKRATVIYLSAIALFAVIFGLLVDKVYVWLGISPRAVIGKAAELFPEWIGIGGAVLLLLLSIRPLSRSLSSLFGSKKDSHHHGGSCGADAAGRRGPAPT